MELREIARDVYACLQPDRGLGTSNSGLVNRAGGLVVDTFWDLPHTRQMIETYARVWRRPARRVVNAPQRRPLLGEPALGFPAQLSRTPRVSPRILIVE